MVRVLRVWARVRRMKRRPFNVAMSMRLGFLARFIMLMLLYASRASCSDEPSPVLMNCKLRRV